MDWSQTISIKIAERSYELRIRKEEEEERIRKASRLINDRLIRNKQRFSDKDAQDLLAIEALWFAVKTFELEARASSTEQADKLNQLNDRLDLFLKKCTE